MGAARPGRRLPARRAPVRPRGRRRRRRAPRHQRHRGLVRRAIRTRRWWRRRCSSRRCWPGRGRRSTTSRSSGSVAASLLGMLLFLRFDMVLALAGFVGAAAIGRVAGQRAGRRLLRHADALDRGRRALPVRPDEAVHGAAARLCCEPAGLAGRAPGDWRGLVALALLVGAARLTITRRLLPVVPPTLIVVVLALAVYAYFFRSAGGRIAEHDAIALRSFALVRHARGPRAPRSSATSRRCAGSLTRDPVFLLTLTIYACFFFYKIRIVPEHYWMARRFLPVILPGALLLVGYAAFGSWHGTTGLPHARRAGRTTRGWRRARVLVALLAATFWQQSRPIFGHVEYAGLIPRLEALAASSATTTSSSSSRATPRTCTCSRCRSPTSTRATCSSCQPPPRPGAVQAVSRLGAHALQARLLHGRRRHRSADARRRRRARRHPGVPGARVGIDRRNALPRGPRRKEFDFSIYRFVRRLPIRPRRHSPRRQRPQTRSRSTSASTTTSTSLRFHAKERHGNGTTFRWSRDVSYISLMGVPASARTLTLVMDDGRRPAAVPPGGDRGGARRPCARHGRRRPRLPRLHAADPAGGRGRSRGRARCRRGSSWSRTPGGRSAVIGVPDDRDLGVMVDRVEVR